MLLMGIMSLTILSCEDSSTNTSVVSSFEKFSAGLQTAPLVVSECEAGTYTVDFTFDEAQITDIDVEISVGSESTATEDEDFVLDTHEFSLEALAGQDGFSVNITVLEDFSEDDAAQEDIYLVFKSSTPTGLEATQVKVITIEDSGPAPQIEEGSYSSTLNPDAADYWFGVASPQTRTVTVTQLSESTYSVSDITSGGYNACCGLPLNQPAVIRINGCNEIFIDSETGADVIGQSAKGTGVFDSETNTFTVFWADQYGSDDDSDPGALLFSTFTLIPD